jgi:hypothetical protein
MFCFAQFYHFVTFSIPFPRYDSWVPHVRVGPALIPSPMHSRLRAQLRGAPLPRDPTPWATAMPCSAAAAHRTASLAAEKAYTAAAAAGEANGFVVSAASATEEARLAVVAASKATAAAAKASPRTAATDKADYAALALREATSKATAAEGSTCVAALLVQDAQAVSTLASEKAHVWAEKAFAAADGQV